MSTYNYFPTLLFINWIPITICHDIYHQCSHRVCCFKLWLEYFVAYQIADVFRCKSFLLRWSLQLFIVLWTHCFFSSGIYSFLFIIQCFFRLCTLAGVFLTMVLHLVPYFWEKCELLLLKKIFLSTYKSRL